jgi:Domain of unknown function (DUF4956)
MPAAPHLEIGDVLPRLAIDIVAITVLVYGIYRRRHRRPDLVVIYALFNIGLFLAVVVMTAGAVGTGFGFGLFAVLSIVRLRSEPFSNIEMAYFFIVLVLALVCGLEIGDEVINAGLAAVAVGAAALIDLPRPMRPTRRSELLLELAFTSEEAARRHIAERLNAEVEELSIQQVNFVRETTRVTVTYVPRPAVAPEPEPIDALEPARV